MIKINEPSNISSTKRSSKKSALSGVDSAHAYFADIMAMVDMATNVNEIASNPAISAPAPIISMDGLLAMQESSQYEVQHQQQVRNAHHMLDGLEELRVAILVGEIPHYLLYNIEQRMNMLKQHVKNPELREIIEDIELRAAVELAKFLIHR